jgi:hypothetical protein
LLQQIRTKDVVAVALITIAILIAVEMYVNPLAA